MVDWRRLSERLGGFEAELQALTGQRDALAASAESIEAAILEAEGRIGEINEAIRQAESRIAANRERIAAEESTVEHERSRAADLEEEIAGHRRRLLTLTALRRRPPTAVSRHDRGRPPGGRASPRDCPAGDRSRAGARS